MENTINQLFNDIQTIDENIADLDYAQAKGLGLVLNEIDKTKDWKKHLIHIFKSCLVHYKR